MDKKNINPNDNPDKAVQQRIISKYEKYLNDAERLNQIIRDKQNKCDLDKQCKLLIKLIFSTN